MYVDAVWLASTLSSEYWPAILASRQRCFCGAAHAPPIALVERMLDLLGEERVSRVAKRRIQCSHRS